MQTKDTNWPQNRLTESYHSTQNGRHASTNVQERAHRTSTSFGTWTTRIVLGELVPFDVLYSVRQLVNRAVVVPYLRLPFWINGCLETSCDLIGQNAPADAAHNARPVFAILDPISQLLHSAPLRFGEVQGGVVVDRAQVEQVITVKKEYNNEQVGSVCGRRTT